MSGKMREILILKIGTPPPDGCTPSTGAPPGFAAWTREVEDEPAHAEEKRAPGKPRTILLAAEMILSGLESEVSEQTPAMPLPFDVNAPQIQATAERLDTMPPLAPALIRQIIAALRRAEIHDLGRIEDPGDEDAPPPPLHALAAQDRRRVLLHLKRLLGATITVDGQREQPNPLADGLAILALIATPAVEAADTIFALRLTAAIVERDTIRAHLVEKMPLPHPPKRPETRTIGSLHLADREAYDRSWKRYEEGMPTWRLTSDARRLEWANRLAAIVGEIEQIRHQRRTASPITWALDLAIQIGVLDPARGTPIGTLRTVARDDAALLDAIAAAVVPDDSKPTERRARSALRALLEEHRGDLLSLAPQDLAPYLTGDLTDATLRKRVERSLAALTAAPKTPDEAERLAWYRARCARLGALLWPAPSAHEIAAEVAALRARIVRHDVAPASPVDDDKPTAERILETLEPERLTAEDAFAIEIAEAMNF